MKTIISLVVGILTFILCIWGGAGLINWITGGFTDMNWRTAVRIILWLCFGGGIIVFSIAVATAIGTIISKM